MILHLILGNTAFNCDIVVHDRAGKRSYQIDQSMSDGEICSLDIEVHGEESEITLIPVPPDFDSILVGIGETSLKGRLAKAAANKLFSGIKDMICRVGCTYRIDGARDGDTVYVNEQEYIFDSFDRLDLLNLIPMIYTFYEIHVGENIGELTGAFGINRKEIINCAKKLALLDFGLHLIVVYPLQVGRIAYLSRNKKIFSALRRFNSMPPEKRQKLIHKMENRI